MRTETKITLDKAARLLGTDLSTLLDEIWVVGIDVQHDRGVGIDYISSDDFEQLKECIRNLSLE